MPPRGAPALAFRFEGQVITSRCATVLCSDRGPLWVRGGRYRLRLRASHNGTYLERGLVCLRCSGWGCCASSWTRSLKRCARCLRCRGRARSPRIAWARLRRAQLRSDTAVLRSSGGDSRIGASNPGPAPRATPPRALVSARATRRALPNLVRLRRRCRRRRRPHPVVSPALGRSRRTVGLCHLAGKPRPLRGRRVAHRSVHRLARGRARLRVRSVPPRPVSLDMTRHAAPSHARFSIAEAHDALASSTTCPRHSTPAHASTSFTRSR
jgi:hypothetical protein